MGIQSIAGVERRGKRGSESKDVEKRSALNLKRMGGKISGGGETRGQKGG